MSNQDPWMHRAAGMKCSSCIWFVEKAPGPIGRCRRHAPTMSGYPVVYQTDWCGDHKLDETKLTNPDAAKQASFSLKETLDRTSRFANSNQAAEYPNLHTGSLGPEPPGISPRYEGHEIRDSRYPGDAS